MLYHLTKESINYYMTKKVFIIGTPDENSAALILAKQLAHKIN